MRGRLSTLLALLVPIGCSSPAATPEVDASTDTAVVVDSSLEVEADAPVDTACPAGRSRCGDSCVDLQSDLAHCGTCSTACVSTESCVSGSCKCTGSTTKCGTACTDTTTDKANCGVCGTACASTEECVGGKCLTACASGEERCAGKCTNTTSDAKNCGTCGTVCKSTEECGAGKCVAACVTPETRCGAACVNTSFDEKNCGGCGKACPFGPNSTVVCSSASCILKCTDATIYGNCDGKDDTGCETDLRTSDTNCGACFKKCATTEACSAGKCVCKTGYASCSAGCTDVSADPKNCGMCGTICGTGENCSSSKCVCNAGLVRCPATTGPCVDLLADPSNCGTCGKVCAAGEACSGGLCCPTGFLGCGTTCVDATLDPKNCGSCGTTCSGTTTYCQAGTCVGSCSTPLSPCADGWCRDLSKDPKNCGTCGTTCLSTETCVAGACVQLGFPGSKIVNADQGKQINAWIGTPTQIWKLCYQKSRDGTTPSAFHSLCDGKGVSVTIAKVGTGQIIGGYAPVSWTSASGYSGNSTAFLFSVTNSYKHVAIGSTYWQYNNSTYGPTWGGGHDWYVNSTMNGGYCNIGYTYACRTGTYGSTTCQNDFCGSYSSWTLAELEVWIKGP